MNRSAHAALAISLRLPLRQQPAPRCAPALKPPERSPPHTPPPHTPPPHTPPPHTPPPHTPPPHTPPPHTPPASLIWQPRRHLSDQRLLLVAQDHVRARGDRSAQRRRQLTHPLCQHDAHVCRKLYHQLSTPPNLPRGQGPPHPLQLARPPTFSAAPRPRRPAALAAPPSRRDQTVARAWEQ
eukprot:7376517-Prymnesium_polylepis.2